MGECRKINPTSCGGGSGRPGLLAFLHLTGDRPAMTRARSDELLDSSLQHRRPPDAAGERPFLAAGPAHNVRAEPLARSAHTGQPGRRVLVMRLGWRRTRPRARCHATYVGEPRPWDRREPDVAQFRAQPRQSRAAAGCAAGQSDLGRYGVGSTRSEAVGVVPGTSTASTTTPCGDLRVFPTSYPCLLDELSPR